MSERLTDDGIREAIYATRTQHRGICHEMADELLTLRALTREVIEGLEMVQTYIIPIDARRVLDAILIQLREAVETP